jgi:bacillopeptidase F (M6 metalloprotease family)
MSKNGQSVYARLARIVPTNEDRGDQERAKAKEYEESMKADVKTKNKLIGGDKDARVQQDAKESQTSAVQESKLQEKTPEVKEKPKVSEGSEGHAPEVSERHAPKRRSPRKRKTGGDE